MDWWRDDSGSGDQLDPLIGPEIGSATQLRQTRRRTSSPNRQTAGDTATARVCSRSEVVSVYVYVEVIDG